MSFLLYILGLFFLVVFGKPKTDKELQRESNERAFEEMRNCDMQYPPIIRPADLGIIATLPEPTPGDKLIEEIVNKSDEVRLVGRDYLVYFFRQVFFEGWTELMEMVKGQIDNANTVDEKTKVRKAFQLVRTSLDVYPELAKPWGNDVLALADARGYWLRPILRGHKVSDADVLLIKQLQKFAGWQSSENASPKVKAYEKSTSRCQPDVDPCQCGFVQCQVDADTGETFISALKIAISNSRKKLPPSSIWDSTWRTTRRSRVLSLQIFFDNMDREYPSFFTQWIELLGRTFPNVLALDLRQSPAKGNFQHFKSLMGLRFEGLEDVGGLTFPVAICNISSLRYLALSDISEVNPCVGKLQNLVELDVRGAGFSKLPPELASLTGLKSFIGFLQGERFDCPPEDMPDRHTCRPTYVVKTRGPDEGGPQWQCAQVDGWNPTFHDPTQPFWGWKSLERFWVDENWFSGSIPEFIADKWPLMRSLDLYNNNLTGPIPRSMLRLDFVKLQLQDNDFGCGEDSLEDSEESIINRILHMPSLRVVNFAINPKLCGCVSEDLPQDKSKYRSKIGVDLSASRMDKPQMVFGIGMTKISQGCRQSKKQEEL